MLGIVSYEKAVLEALVTTTTAQHMAKVPYGNHSNFDESTTNNFSRKALQPRAVKRFK